MSQALPPSGGPQDVKLSDQEQKLVAKLLSDPTYFPLEFRTWLKNYIEGAGIIVGTSQVRGSSSAGIRTGLPAGIVIICADTGAVPPDALTCDGTAYLRTTESALYAKIGTRWGVGDGSTTFNVPDLRDRTLYGAGSVVSLAETDGVPFGSRGGPGHIHLFGREAVGLTPGGTTYSILGNQSVHDASTDQSPPGGDQQGWAGVIYAITNGKAA